MARSRGISGVAIGMIGTGALLIRAAIRGTSPMDELRQLITGQRPEPLSTEARGTPITVQGAGTATATGPGGSAHTTGREAPHVQREMSYTAATWKINVYGYRARGSVPGSKHPKGLAFDAMVPKGAQGKEIGNAIAAHYVGNAKVKDVDNVIWWGRIWNQPRGWHTYIGPSPHKDHVHVDFHQVIRGREGR